MSKQNKRRILNIGPGLLIALAISVVIMGVKYKQNPQQPNTPPIIERHVVSSSDIEKLGPTPEVEFIIDRADELDIDKDQLSKLQKLDSEWKAFSGPKLAQANEAASKTAKYLAETKANGKIPVAQVQDNAQPVIALSGELAHARQEFWQRAMKLLTPEQRKIVQAKREAVWAEMKAKKPLSR